MSIHLKRVTYNNHGFLTLNTAFVSYPDILDMSTIGNLRSDDYPTDIKYKLSGVIEHFGSAHGGHYVAYRPLFTHNHEKGMGREDEKWLLCDDSKITYVQKQDVLRRKAYMLIYEKIPPLKLENEGAS